MNTKLDNALIELKNRGLNLFAAVPVSLLPEDIKKSFEDQGIQTSAMQTLCLIGHGGKELWKHLPHPLHEEEHPIDQYSIRAMQDFAKMVFQKEIKVLFPDPLLCIPLQRISRFVNLSRHSLLGLDIGREYGVWFAFRGVFLVEEKMAPVTYPAFVSPCESCIERPCIKVCPAGAVGEQNLNLSKCAGFRLSENSSCEKKCLARLACPYQAHHRYSDEQIHYHMGRVVHLKKLASYTDEA